MCHCYIKIYIYILYKLQSPPPLISNSLPLKLMPILIPPSFRENKVCTLISPSVWENRHFEDLFVNLIYLKLDVQDSKKHQHQQQTDCGLLLGIVNSRIC
jgi:hypothetical protein